MNTDKRKPKFDVAAEQLEWWIESGLEKTEINFNEFVTPASFKRYLQSFNLGYYQFQCSECQAEQKKK